jgi:hypothetical protein
MATLTFFADGFEFGGTITPIYDFILYKNVKRLKVVGTTVWVHDGDKPSDPVKIVNESVEDAIADVEQIRARVQQWFRRNAVKRDEKRARLAAESEFRASLLAHLGALTERIAFDPDVGDEALDAIERCKKRAREGED